MTDNQTNNNPATDREENKPTESDCRQPSTENIGNQTVTIELLRHRQLFSVLHNPLALWKFIGILMVVVVLLFIILATVSLIIKRYYPYNDIQTNIYGATTLKNEDKDVTYWLFNTAEMWANTGIPVKENDILTIRTSGAWHTAIHHLVDDARSNSVLRDDWIGSDGGVKSAPNDSFRSKFKISQRDIDGVMLMAVFPDDKQNGHQTLNQGMENKKDFFQAIDSGEIDIYRIGRERVDVRILSDGILHFAVNEIILTRRNIKQMYLAYIDSLSEYMPHNQYSVIKEWVKGWNPDEEIRFSKEIEESDASFNDSQDSILWANGTKSRYPLRIKFGKSPEEKTNKLLNNELIYYYNKQFYDAWFVDNIGSALIIIEHKHSDRK